MPVRIMTPSWSPGRIRGTELGTLIWPRDWNLDQDFLRRCASRTWPNVRVFPSAHVTRQKVQPLVFIFLPVIVALAASPAAEEVAYRWL